MSEDSSTLLHQDSMKAVALTVRDGGEEKADTGAGEEEPLPEGWEKHQSKSNPGMFYFFNSLSGETVWTRPTAKKKSPQSPPASPLASPDDPAEDAAPDALHLQDIPIAPPKGVVGIIPSPKRRVSASSSWSSVSENATGSCSLMTILPRAESSISRSISRTRLA